MKKLISILLLLCVISAGLIFAACNDKPASTPADGTTEAGDASEEQTETEDGATYPEPDLPDMTFKEPTFTVLTRHNGTEGYDIYADVDSGDTLKEAVYQRNMLIEEKYGVTIRELPETDATVDTVLYNSVAANEHIYDMTDINFQQSYTAASQGLLIDLASGIDYLDLSNPWWDHGANKDFTICNKQYFVIGNANLDALRGTWALIYNKDMMLDLGYDENHIYDLVKEGKWTLDEFYNIAKKGVAKDLNNDNNMTSVDSYALSSNGASLFGFMTTSGLQIVEKTPDDELIFRTLDDRTNDILNQLSKILDTRMTYNASNPNQTADSADSGSFWTQFLENRSLFFSESFRSIEYFRDMNSDFGIIPHPKYSEDEQYRSFIHAYIGAAFGIPTTAPDKEKTAIMMEYMTYLSTDTVLPVFYERVLEGKYTRDEESFKMINEYILPYRVYDAGIALDIGGFSFQLYNLFVAEQKAFASTYKRSEENIQAAVEAINEAFR